MRGILRKLRLDQLSKTPPSQNLLDSFGQTPHFDVPVTQSPSSSKIRINPRLMVDQVRQIAEAAGHELMQHFGHETSFLKNRENGAMSTEAGQQAEKIILKGLHDHFPDYPIVTESQIAKGKLPKNLGRYFWLVEALDGSKAFIKKENEFTVNIALIDQKRPVLGVIHAPALQRTYTGAGRGTATLYLPHQDPRTIHVRPEQKQIVVAVSRYHGDAARLRKYLEHHEVGEIKYITSSLKFCIVADSLNLEANDIPYDHRVADLFIRFGHSMEWDTAAGDAILYAAGGSVVVGNHSLTYGKPDFRNPSFIAKGGSSTFYTLGDLTNTDASIDFEAMDALGMSRNLTGGALGGEQVAIFNGTNIMADPNSYEYKGLFGYSNNTRTGGLGSILRGIRGR